MCRPNTSNGSWSPQGVIVWSVSSPVPTANPDGYRMPVDRLCRFPGTAGGWSPDFLPDGRRFVYVIGGVLGRGRDLWLASLDPGEKPRRIGEASRRGQFIRRATSSGSSTGSLWPGPSMWRAESSIGESFPLKAPLAHRVFFGYLLAEFSANAQGMLVYPPQTNSLTELRWRDRTGKQLGTLGAPGEYYTPRISPDGRQAAFTRRDGNNSDIWVANLDANSFTRLTFDPAIDENPVWSPDGSTMTFAN